MGKVEFLNSSLGIAPNADERKSAQSLIINENIPYFRDEQVPSFGDVLEKAYEDFPKFKIHAYLHPSEYDNTLNLINVLPIQLQDKWKLLKLRLWNQFGSQIFGIIFNLTPDQTRMETRRLSDLPAKFTNMALKPSKEDDDENEEKIVEDKTNESVSKRFRVNQEKREFVILAEGGERWNALKNNQRFILAERFLADHPENHKSLARLLKVNISTVREIEKQALRKIGFFGDSLRLTTQQLQIIFQNAKEDYINRLNPKELELLKQLYGYDLGNQRSFPTLEKVGSILELTRGAANRRHQRAMQKLLHTKRTILIDTTSSPTSEQKEFMRQYIPIKGTKNTAREMHKKPEVVRRWQIQEGIQLLKRGGVQISPSPEKLEFIISNYSTMSLTELKKMTHHHHYTITRWLREAGIQ